MNNNQAVNKILNSSHLKDIYFYALGKKFFMQKEIIKNTNLKYHAHVSKSLKELSELGLVICENPNDKNFKRYQITPKAKQIEEEIKKYY